MAWCEVCEYEPDNDSTVCTEETKIKANCPYQNKRRETMMNKFYIGKCSKGLIVFKAIANTPLEQADCAKDIIKVLLRKGLVLSWLMQILQHQLLNGAMKPDARGV